MLILNGIPGMRFALFSSNKYGLKTAKCSTTNERKNSKKVRSVDFFVDDFITNDDTN